MRRLPVRRTRSEAKEDTRARLLAAARRVFVREGFHGATVDMVAAEAGFTKGAVYSAFTSKADLFLAVYEQRMRERSAAIARRLAEVPAEEVTDVAWRTWAESLRRDRTWHLVLIEFWVFAARDRETRARFARLHGEMRSAIAREIAAARAAGRSGAIDADAIARAHMALGNGFALEAFLEPEIATGSAYEDAATALNAALVEPAAEPLRRAKR
ncbi:MAG TPA: helix-turn-helix domain-containing protein [Candidatus Binatia bacterium]|nr:helix-turn-helix domain-containing protein [Candidatus Binatia bacterium]